MDLNKLIARKEDIEDKLSHAQAALTAHQERFAFRGLVAAIGVKISAQITLDECSHPMPDESKILNRIRSAQEQAIKLIAAYEDDFVMRLKDQPEAVRPIINIQPRNPRGFRAYPTDMKVLAKELWTIKPPSDSKNSYLKAIQDDLSKRYKGSKIPDTETIRRWVE